MSLAKLCDIEAIVPGSGRAVLVDGMQIAVFRVVENGIEQFHAIDNYCPFSETNVLSRGIVGSLQGRVVVASPVYKQHFDLQTGTCVEDAQVSVKTHQVVRQGTELFLVAAGAAAA